MGKIKIPSESNNENVDQENHRIFQLQKERQDLIEAIFYQDSIDKLLQKWQDIIKKITFEAISKKKKNHWNSHLETCLNNYQCSGIWYQDFIAATNSNDSPTQRLVAYLLFEKVIMFTFKRITTPNDQFSTNHHLVPEKIIVLEPEEASKFSYIVGWVIYKLTKNDHITRSHSEFESICIHLILIYNY